MRRQRDTNRTLPVTLITFVLLILLIPCLLFCRTGYSQAGEFQRNPNGLIYADSTIVQLEHIVDSLNLKFKVCALNPKYRAVSQGIGYYVFLKKKKVIEAQKDMEQDIAFDDFVKKYTPIVVKKNLLVVRFKGETYKGKPEITFSSVKFGDENTSDFSFEEDLSRYEGTLKGKWAYSYDKDEKVLMAFYFQEGLKQPTLPAKYARLVQYSDCLVDTTTQIFTTDAQKSSRREEEKESAAVNRFLEFVHEQTVRPVYDENKEEEFYKKYALWDSTRLAKINNGLAKTAQFRNLLAEAVADALNKNVSDAEFEEYVQLYYSPKTALELKRRRIVVGTCSMDSSPREHAFSIAQLSAETINWEIFLRAHLDIMNDHFQRASDGNYAWAGRKTYIRELEVLDINVPDLLFGITLRLENPATNHYFGSVSRLGRAFSESEQVSKLETEMLNMIKDPELDDYNRILMYYLFLNFNHHVSNKEKQAENRKRLNETIRSLPEYLASQAILKN